MDPAACARFVASASKGLSLDRVEQRVDSSSPPRRSERSPYGRRRDGHGGHRAAAPTRRPICGSSPSRTSRAVAVRRLGHAPSRAPDRSSAPQLRRNFDATEPTCNARRVIRARGFSRRPCPPRVVVRRRPTKRELVPSTFAELRSDVEDFRVAGGRAYDSSAFRAARAMPCAGVRRNQRARGWQPGPASASSTFDARHLAVRVCARGALHRRCRCTRTRHPSSPCAAKATVARRHRAVGRRPTFRDFALASPLSSRVTSGRRVRHCRRSGRGEASAAELRKRRHNPRMSSAVEHNARRAPRAAIVRLGSRAPAPTIGHFAEPSRGLSSIAFLAGRHRGSRG